ncbi:MAG TPA: tetratricopeptide repeat protein [Vicinamibacteria bacterium]|nr:tetratricopeptide repeat protein [Vicinamibacteria bacterium]
MPPRSRAPGPDARVVPGVTLRVFPGDACGPGSLALVLNALGDDVAERDLAAALPRAPGGGVLSVDLLLAARRRGFDAALVAGTAEEIRSEVASGRPAVLMLRLLDLPGHRRDVHHYVVADGSDPSGGLFRFQFGDGKARWAPLASVEKGWAATAHALLVVWPSAESDAALRRAVALESAGRIDDAVALYRQVLTVRPDSVRAWVDVGNAEATRRRTDAAEEAYRRALDRAPEDRDALNNLAWLLLEQGTRLEEAEALAERAARQPGPDRPLAQDTLGRIQLARRLCAEAARTFSEALAEASEAPEATRARLRDGLDRARSCGDPGR